MSTGGFREVMIASKSILSYQNNWLVVRSLEGEKKVFLDEVEVVIVENPACSITAFCVAEIAKRNIKLVFCDEKHNPISENVPLYGSYDCSAKLRTQISWAQSAKDDVWQRIIKMKIWHQAYLLKSFGLVDAAQALVADMDHVQPGDPTNREAMAARTYLNALFGLDFNRDRKSSEDYINAAMNYGYAVLTSLFNRYVVAAGYSTQLGIFHRGSENYFNLSCDLMEPYRPIVDQVVLSGHSSTFDSEEKHRVAREIFTEVRISGVVQSLDNAVPIYLRSAFDALNAGDPEVIVDYEL